MTIPFSLQLAGGILFGLLLGSVFMLYRNPMFEVYLISWGLC